jgi:hypothetical protein
MKYQPLYQTVKDANIMEILNIILNINILRAVFPSAALSSLPWLILTIIRWAENRKGRKRRGTTRWNGKPVAICSGIFRNREHTNIIPIIHSFGKCTKTVFQCLHCSDLEMRF